MIEMKLTRRNTLIGFGAIAGGIGVVGASGAFDTVQADRNFDVEVADDAAALLELQPGDGDSADEYVDDEDGLIAINIGTEEEGEDNDAGLNDDALTGFHDLLKVGNNGSQDAEIWFDTGEKDGIGFIVDDDDITDRDSTETDPDTTLIEVGDDPVDITLEVDTREEADNEYGGPYEYEEGQDVPVINIHASTDGVDE